VALLKLDFSELAVNSNTGQSTPRKRPSEESHLATRKQVLEQLLVLPNNKPSSPFATVSVASHRSLK